MTHGAMKIPSRGACIYCARKHVPLTDEHVVPLALGGVHILKGASCHACADITKKFEQDVARELWGDARNSYNAPSRRKKQRKTYIVLADPDNPTRRIKVPYSEYPAAMVFYKMQRAGLLEGSRCTAQAARRRPKPLVFQCRLLAMTPWLAGAERPSSIVAPMATVGQQPQRRPGGPSGSLRRPTQRSPRPRTELSENGIGDGGQVAAPAGRAVDLVRASQWIKRRNAPQPDGRSMLRIFARSRPTSVATLYSLERPMMPVRWLTNRSRTRCSACRSS